MKLKVSVADPCTPAHTSIKNVNSHITPVSKEINRLCWSQLRRKGTPILWSRLQQYASAHDGKTPCIDTTRIWQRAAMAYHVWTKTVFFMSQARELSPGDEIRNLFFKLWVLKHKLYGCHTGKLQGLALYSTAVTMRGGREPGQAQSRLYAVVGPFDGGWSTHGNRALSSTGPLSGHHRFDQDGRE